MILHMFEYFHRYYGIEGVVRERPAATQIGLLESNRGCPEIFGVDICRLDGESPFLGPY